MKNDPSVELAATLIRSGCIDDLLADQEALFVLATTESLGPTEQLEAKARSAQLQLLMMRRQRAATSLAPYIETIGEDRIDVLEGQIESLERTAPPYLAGLVLGQIANLLYRYFRYEEGAGIARKANSFLRRKDNSTTVDQLLAEHENRIWWARLQWHCGRTQDAETLLRDTIAELTNRVSEMEPGGVHLLVALAFDLWASFDLQAGRIEGARRKIYQACFLLRAGEVSCKTRLAHALYMAGRIETSAGFQTLGWSSYLFDEADAVFKEINHPFQLRVKAQKAQGLSRAGHVGDAIEILREVEDSLEEGTLDRMDIDEARYVRADVLLTRVWILEHDAINGQAQWQECARLAEELLQIAPVPRRLEVEGGLHFGLALIHDPDRTTRDRGARRLEETLRRAVNLNQRKIQVAACFALAEYHLENNELSRAQDKLNTGIELMANVRSSFLFKWKRRLGNRLGQPAAIEVRLDQDLNAAIEQLTRQFVSYHASRSSDRDALWKTLNISPAKGYRLLRDMRLVSRRGSEEDLQQGTLPEEPRDVREPKL